MVMIERFVSLGTLNALIEGDKILNISLNKAKYSV